MNLADIAIARNAGWTGPADAHPTRRFCYGTCCPVHAMCERYRAVEQMDPAVDRAMDSCEAPDHSRPLFWLIPAGGG